MGSFFKKVSSRLESEADSSAAKNAPIETIGSRGPSAMSEPMRDVRARIGEEKTQEVLDLLRKRGVRVSPDTTIQIKKAVLDNPGASSAEVAQKYLGFDKPGTINVVPETESKPPLSQRLKQPEARKEATISGEEPAISDISADENPQGYWGQDAAEYAESLKNLPEGGLEGAATRPDADVVPSGAGGVPETGIPRTVEPASQPGTETKPAETLKEATDRASPTDSTKQAVAEGSKLRSLTMPAAAAGTAAAAAGVGYLASSGQAGEPPREERFKPVVSPTGTIGMSDEEYKYLERTVGTVRAEREKNSKYQDLNDRFQERQASLYDSIGMTQPSPGTAEGRKTLVSDANKFLNETYKPKAATPAAPAEGPKGEEKKAVDQPPPSSQGGMPPPAGGTSVHDTGEPDTKQEKLQDSVDKAVFDINKFADKLGANKQIDRTKLDELLSSLEGIKPDTATYKDPATRNFLRDRAEAYKLYKEEADRNQWMELAQSLVNSLTQFASAQAAIGTGKAGGGLPLPSIDYGRRTEQAFREYQAQAADIGAEERSVKEEQERIDRLRAQDLATRRAGLSERITAERERIRDEEARADRARGFSVSLYGVLEGNKLRHEEITNRNEIAKLKAGQKVTENTIKAIDDAISDTEKYIKKEEEKLAAANAVQAADKKHYGMAVAKFATSQGDTFKNTLDAADKQSGMMQSDKDELINGIVQNAATQSLTNIEAAKKQLEELRAAKQGKRAPGTATTPTKTTTTSSSTIVPPDISMVKVRAPDGRVGSIPTEKLNQFLKDNPGASLVDRYESSTPGK